MFTHKLIKTVVALLLFASIAVAQNPKITEFDSSGNTVIYGDDAGLFRIVDPVNDGNPLITVGSGTAEQVRLSAIFDTGAQTLDYALFQTDAASATADKGLFRFSVDGTDILDIDDGGIEMVGATTFINLDGSAVFNEQGADVDFKVEASGVDPAFFVQGSDGFVGLFTSTPGYQVDISGTNMLIGADEPDGSTTRTNSTNKFSRITFPHYTNSEEPVSIIGGASLTSTAQVNFGGGLSAFNAATQLGFFTASNGTTVSGTERLRITSTGLCQISPDMVNNGYGTTTGLLVAPDLAGGTDAFDRAYQIAPVQLANATGNAVLMYVLPTINSGVTQTTQVGILLDSKQGLGSITGYAGLAMNYSNNNLGATNHAGILMGQLVVPSGNFSAYDVTGDEWYIKGDVGINTTAPAAKTEINAATTTDVGLIVQSTDDNATNNLVEVQDSAGAVLTSIGGTGAAVFNEQGSDVDFKVEASGVDPAFFVQGSDGNVGFGTGTPTGVVHIDANGDDSLVSNFVGMNLRLENTGANRPGILLNETINMIAWGTNLGGDLNFDAPLAVGAANCTWRFYRYTTNTGLSLIQYFKPDGTGNIRAFEIDCQTGNTWIKTGLQVGDVSFGNPTPAPTSTIVAGGNVSIGVNYDGTAAPTNGLIVEGDVGINTTSPAAKTEINAATTTDVGLIVQTTDDNATNNLVEIQDSAGAVLTSIGGTGIFTQSTGGTGTAQTVLPEGAIDGTEILDDTIAFGDILYTITLPGNPALLANEQYFGANGIIFEGLTADTTEGLLTVSTLTADRTWTLPNVTGTFALTANKLSVFNLTTSDELDGVITDDTGSGALVFAASPTLTGNVTVDGKSGSPNGAITLGAAATAIALTRNVHTITGDAGANTIATITGGVDGQIVTFIFVDGLVTITDDNTHAADSIDLSAAFTSADDTTLQLVYDGTSWYETTRSSN